MAYRIAFFIYRPITPKLNPQVLRRHQLGSGQMKLKVKVKGQGQIGQKLDFSAGVPHNFFLLPTDYAQVAPAGAHRHQLRSRERKLKVKAKSQGQMGPKPDFSDGVPHNFFHLLTHYAQIAPAGVTFNFDLDLEFSLS